MTDIEPRAQLMLIVAFASALPVAAVPAIETVDTLLVLLPPPPPPQPANNATDAISSPALTERMTCCCRVLIEVYRWFVCRLNDFAGASIPPCAQFLMEYSGPAVRLFGVSTLEMMHGALRDIPSSRGIRLGEV